MASSLRAPSESHRAGKRGRHKRHRSPETQTWEREHLVPERPCWMPESVYVQLAALRSRL